ncbi:MAG: RsmB/NOP family class I SAM-dependent RNA methyltransferase [Candidatus Nanohaloarchaea archaeon]|nr:RsmB/NOP family class I SAM-dependent RNA methyltransferase [Candidatus Nanohaloarchaea archaeon]
MERYSDIVPEFEEFREIADEPQPFDARVNTLKASVDEVRDLLSEAGVEFEQRDWNEDFLKLDSRPGKTLAHWLGKIYVQESVSGIPPLALDPEPGDSVLDMCAAPGSKTTQMSAMMDNRGSVVANDVSQGRIKALLSNVYRTGCMNVKIVKNDGRHLKEDKEFDKILVDAPCSAEGNMRESPEVREGADAEKIEGLKKLQKQLLEKAFNLCKPGGTVVYSTCTFAPEENEEVVSNFLDRGKLEEPEFDFPHSNGITAWKGEIGERLERCVRVYPHQLDSGGVFVAKFRKEA